MELPKPLKNFIDDTPISKIGVWIENLVIFYFKPRVFFKIYQAQNITDKIKQCALYTFIFFIFLTILTDFNKADILKIPLSLFLVSLPLSVLIYFVCYILRLGYAIAIQSISFVYVSFLLWQIPNFLFYWLFFRNEDYTFLLISNIINCYTLLFLFFFFWFTINLKPLKIVIAIVLNVIILNIAFFPIGFLSIQKNSNADGLDPIVQEVNQKLPEIQSYPGLVYSTIISIENRKMSFDSLTIKSNDTLYHYSKDGITLYREMSRKNVILIDTMIKKSHFETTREILRPLKRFYFLMDTYFEYPPCDTCLIKSIVYKNRKTDSIVKQSNEYIIDEDYLKNFHNFEKKIAELSKKSDKANSPMVIPGLILYPYYFIAEQLGGKVQSLTTLF